MSARPASPIGPSHGRLVARCRELGFTLALADRAGRVAWWPDADEVDPADRLAESPEFQRALGDAVDGWASASQPEPVQLMPGCWVLAIPRFERRRLCGYHLAVARTARKAGTDPRAPRPITEADLPAMARSVRWLIADADQLDRHQQEIDLLSRQLGETYEELSLVYKLSTTMTVTIDPARFIREACEDLQEVVGFRWVAAKLVGHEEPLKNLRHGVIWSGRPECSPADLGAFMDGLIGMAPSDRPRIIDDARDLDLPGPDRVARHLVVAPITKEGRSHGVLVAADKAGADQLTSVDSKLVVALAQHVGIFLENAMLYEDVQHMFMGSLRALISSIDAKDTYTSGHSERVAWLSRELAAAAGLSPRTVERVHLSGLLHDVGKIGVPEAVLCKPGRLTRDEFEMIKKHPEIGAKILKDIRQMQDLIPGVLHHHERYDGKGYPHGLAGEGIPLFGRLIGLADAFDAMSSTRTYRAAMSHADVLAEVRRCAGEQFDPELARVFVGLDFAPFHEMVREHRRRESLDTDFSAGSAAS